jgi:large subunit ribosomal protein L21
MYAVVRSGGKQYRVEEGRSLKVDRLHADEGSTVELNDVLLIADDGKVTVGAPAVEGARVLAMVEEHGRGKKIIVFKYKAKVRTRKKTGHRQDFTRLSVVEILAPGQEPKKEKPARRKKAAGEDKPPEAEAVEEQASEQPVAEAPEGAIAEAEAPLADEAAEEKPKRRITRRPRTSAPKAEKEEKAPKSSKKDSPEAKPKRTRKKAEDKD